MSWREPLGFVDVRCGSVLVERLAELLEVVVVPAATRLAEGDDDGVGCDEVDDVARRPCAVVLPGFARLDVVDAMAGPVHLASLLLLGCGLGEDRQRGPVGV
jgi:hypothetical protein